MLECHQAFILEALSHELRAHAACVVHHVCNLRFVPSISLDGDDLFPIARVVDGAYPVGSVYHALRIVAPIGIAELAQAEYPRDAGSEMGNRREFDKSTGRMPEALNDRRSGRPRER